MPLLGASLFFVPYISKQGKKFAPEEKNKKKNGTAVLTNWVTMEKKVGHYSRQTNALKLYDNLLL